MELFSFLCLRVEVDLLRLPLNEMQLFTKVLDPGKGKLVFLVTRRPCWGVSISDIETAALEKPDEKQAILERFVSPFFVLFSYIVKYRYHNPVPLGGGGVNVNVLN